MKIELAGMKNSTLYFGLALIFAFSLLSPSASAKAGPIGLSLAQLSHGGLESIPMPPAHSVHGQPRLSGISADKMTLFEVIGNPTNVSEVELMAFMPSDDASQRAKGIAEICRLMENAAPGWNGAFSWALDAMKRAAATPNTDVVLIRNNRRYEMYCSRERGNLILTVKHK